MNARPSFFEPPRVQCSHALDGNATTCRKPVGVRQGCLHPLGDMNAPRGTVGFHAACGVHSISPDIIDVAAGANHTPNGRPGVDANAHLQTRTIDAIERLPREPITVDDRGLDNFYVPKPGRFHLGNLRGRQISTTASASAAGRAREGLFRRAANPMVVEEN